MRRRRFRVPPRREPPIRVNELIRAPEVRVIDSDGSQIGVMPVHQGIEAAQSRGLDLVEVAGNATPPVCRITDFDKYRYEQKKKERGAKHKGGSAGVKEVKMGARTGAHDVDFKVKMIRRFVGEGQRVKVSVRFRGREIVKPELGRNLLDRIFEQTKDVAQPEGTARMEGRFMSVLLTPR